MKIVGLITEYNPFHNGHQYHIEQAKKLTGADRVVVVMSGDFVQRGQPALLPKHLRAEMALACGASVVFELPVCYATGSAELFAAGAVSLLDQLGIVDAICFGSECGDIHQLEEISRILAEEPEAFRRCLKQQLQQGVAFPIAREAALEACYPELDAREILSHPNNILGIEYLKALHMLGSSITPVTMTRIGGHYHDQSLRAEYSSATSIRLQLEQAENFQTIAMQLQNQIPGICASILAQNYKIQFPIYMDAFSLVLKYCLLSHTDFSDILDVTPDLSNRILRERNNFQSCQQFCSLLKTRELTYTRISRALIHILLQIKQADVQAYQSQRYHFYARLLGFQKEHTDVLSAIKQNSRLPLLTKLADYTPSSPTAASMFHCDCFASDLYQSVITDLYETPFLNEYQKKIILI